MPAVGINKIEVDQDDIITIHEVASAIPIGVCWYKHYIINEKSWYISEECLI